MHHFLHSTRVGRFEKLKFNWEIWDGNTLTLYTNAAAALSEESWGSPTMRVRSGWPERDFV